MAQRPSSAKNYFNLPATAWQGIFCDLTVLFCTVFLTDSLRPLLEKEILDPAKSMDQYSASIGWLYVAAAIAQTAGMWLLRPMIRHQQHTSGSPAGTGAFIGAIFLLVMHLAIFGFLMIWDGFNYIWGPNTGFKIVLPILLCLLPTITAIIISFPGKPLMQLSKLNFWLGWLGTILVTFSIVIVAQTCWHILLDGAGKELHMKSTTGNILVVLLFGFVFLLMYLPPRYAFLVTDYNKKSTWFWILAVYAPFAYDVIRG